METLIGLMLALAAYNTFGSKEPPGTFTAIQTNGALVLMDTRTGTFSRCTIERDVVTCVPVAAK